MAESSNASLRGRRSGGGISRAAAAGSHSASRPAGSTMTRPDAGSQSASSAAAMRIAGAPTRQAKASPRPASRSAIGAARGPGSFTGLRIGLSIAAGLAYARHLPLYLMDSLPIQARK
ncbi:MAG TPA: hypothetical protein VHW91_01180, partial [Candidatus Dormibacteraeota bacterium]|nr:hypothetical protein [Candidatus Dormibacteraeota bacterium]